MLHRLKTWWSNFWLHQMFSRLAGLLYDWWFPFSERAHDSYDYSRWSRQNRVKWLWRRLRRLVRKSSLGSAMDAFKSRWYDWWYPASDEGHTYPSYHGGSRRHRLVRDWRRFSRFVQHSFIGRGYEALTIRFYEWFYPPSKESHSHPSYSYRRRNRLELAWNKVEKRIHSSWLGRKYRKLANDFFEWYYQIEDDSGYGYGSHRLRRQADVVPAPPTFRRLRKTWLGRKTGWLLDEIADLVLQVRIDIAEVFNWHRVQHQLKRWQTWVVLVGLITATGLGYKYGLPRYHRFMEQRYALQAQQFAAKHDFPRAMLRARQVFNLNPDNLVVIGLVGDLADYFGSPNALQWRQRLVYLKPDPTNRLALARTALRVEAFPFPTATKALNEIEPAFQQSAAYQLVAGALAIKLSDLPTAEQHYEEALKMNPDDPVSRMSLAVVRLQSGNPKLITDSRTTLELLSTDRQLGLLAARSLVAESIAHRDFARAEMLSDQILTNRQVSFSDRVVHLAVLNAEKSPSLKTFLGETQKHAEENPFYVGELASWMNHYGFAQDGLNWLTGLPARLTGQGLVPIAIADAYVTVGQWKKLTDYLEKERWPQMDAVRIGLMSFAYRKQFSGEQYSISWQQAVLLAARSPNMLNTLAEMAAGWGWKEEAADVLWFAAGKYPDQNWPLASLEKFYTGRQRHRPDCGVCSGTWSKKIPKTRRRETNFCHGVPVA